MILLKLCESIVYFKPKNMLLAFPRRVSEMLKKKKKKKYWTRKMFFSLKPNQDHKLLIIEIGSVVLKL